MLTQRDPAHILRRGMLFLGVLAVILAIAVRTRAPATQNPNLVGQPAPAFALTAEVNGAQAPGPVRLPAQSGHPLLLVFTYSLCPRCTAEVQGVRELQTRESAHGLDVLYLDSPAEGAGIVNAYMQRLGVTAPVLLDTGGNVASRYDVQYYPGVVALDGAGIVRYIATGETSQAELASAITHLLSLPASGSGPGS